MATQAQIEALLKRMREMSAADISVLQANAQSPESSMTTAPGSPNEALWSEMAALGWLTAKDEDLELAEGMHFPMTIYTISPEGLEPITNLLATLSQAPL